LNCVTLSVPPSDVLEDCVLVVFCFGRCVELFLVDERFRGRRSAARRRLDLLLELGAE